MSYIFHFALLFRAIQLLCEAGADHLLTDIEGNFPKDLAEKHHNAKCAKFLASLQKRKVSKGKNDGGSATVSLLCKAGYI